MTADWPPREFGKTVACGEGRHTVCAGRRSVNGEDWGPCTCVCHVHAEINEPDTLAGFDE